VKVIGLRGYFRGYSWLMKHILPVANHPQRKLIEERIRIIKFFDQHGEQVTREAFGKARSTIFLWKKRLRDSGGRLAALAPLSKAPKRPPTKRAHQSLDRMPPLKYYISNYLKDPAQSNMLWTRTVP